MRDDLDSIWESTTPGTYLRGEKGMGKNLAHQTLGADPCLLGIQSFLHGLLPQLLLLPFLELFELLMGGEDRVKNSRD